jgi:flagellar biosynthesis/type III secretory pathway chaperone
MNDLLGVLDTLVEVYEEFSKIVENERFCLLESNVDQLSEINKAKDILIAKARANERLRVSLMAKLSDSAGVHLPVVRLSDLEGKVADADLAQIRERQLKLRDLVTAVIERNRSNELLAQNALKTIRGAMKYLKDELGQNSVYKREGAVSSPVPSGQFVSREA